MITPYPPRLRGSVQVTLLQSGDTLSGTWEVTFPSSSNNGGSLTGSVKGGSISATSSPSAPSACSFKLTAVGTGNRITGTYVSFDCTVVITGTIEAKRQ